MHPVLVVFSLGLLAMSVLFNAVGLASRHAVWATLAVQNLEAGLAGGAAAGMFALASVAGTPAGSRARRLVTFGTAAQLGGLGLFGAALTVRRVGQSPFPGTGLVALAAGGLALLALAAWLSFELDGAPHGRTARTNPSARW